MGISFDPITIRSPRLSGFQANEGGIILKWIQHRCRHHCRSQQGQQHRDDLLRHWHSPGWKKTWWLDDIHGLNYICMIHWISLSWISINNSKSIDIPWLIMLMVDHWTKDQGVTSTLVIVDHHIATTSTNVGYQNWSARHWKKTSP